MAMSRVALAVIAMIIAVASAGRVVNKTAGKVSPSAPAATKVEKHEQQKTNKTVVTAAPVKPVVQATAIAATTHTSEMADLTRFAQEMAKEERAKWPQVHEKWSFDEKSNATLSLKVPAKAAVVPNFLRHSAETMDTCQCHFKNYCTCEAAIEFMDCIENACTSKTCDCHQLQYKHACLMMADTCSSLKMTCETVNTTTHKATCVGPKTSDLPEMKEEEKLEDKSTPDLLKELKQLKEQHCQLYFDHKNGWVNADEQMKVVQAKIDRRMEILEKRNAKIPEMHCYKDFKEYEYPEGPPKAAASRVASSVVTLVGAAAYLIA